MEEDIYLKKLAQRNIKPTAMRLLILRAMLQFDRAFSLLDLETYLDTVDKSTLSRTINLFLKHHLIHGIDDGSGSLKYAVCGNECNCDIDDLHVHFYCTNCHRTYCLGANAVIGVDLDYETVGGSGSMLMVTATGTAVTIE